MSDQPKTAPKNEILAQLETYKKETLAKLDREEQERRLERRMKALATPRRFKKPYEIRNPEQEKIFNQIMDYVENAIENLSQGRNAFLIGRMGTGKTHLAYHIGSKLVQKGFSVLALTAAEYIAEIKDTWKKESNKRPQEIREKYSQIDFLILDEIGVTIPDPLELQEFYTLLKSRYDDQLPTIFLANVQYSDFPKYIGERSWDKVKENSFPPLIFTWQSFRN